MEDQGNIFFSCKTLSQLCAATNLFYMNQLIHETSPYLLQHAHNPVEWHAWKPEVFEKAKLENKPVLVSIGYSTCHWCHVMERESFEDPDVAAFMNEHFINIKVDREERPDVDQIYMEVCQVIQQSGGWPLNAFLMPDGRPFYAGTYYPPRQGYGKPSWMQLLHHLYHSWKEKPEVGRKQAERLRKILKKSKTKPIGRNRKMEPPGATDGQDLADRIFEKMSAGFDRLEGGFGGAPKFPGTMSIEFLIRYSQFYRQPAALEHALFSLDKMIMGGIYDQIGGGFARYATDRAWLIPHFEKMLYDNALLVAALAEAYQLTGKEIYKEAATETLEWVEREMTNPTGGFYSALDADSEGEEGKFYVWDKSEIDEALGSDSAYFCEFYGVSASGNWEGKNILHRKETAEAFATRKQIEVADFKKIVKAGRQKLLARRAERVRPGLDDKVLLDWNALMVTALSKAYKAFDVDAYQIRVQKNLDFLLEKFSRKDGTGFFHSYKNGVAKYDAFLDDYAFLIAALLDVYEITFKTAYLDKARELSEFVIQNFFDSEENQFYFTSVTQEKLIVRRKSVYDSATPSGNAVMLLNLQKLAIIFDRQDFQNIADQMLDSIRSAVTVYPASFAKWAQAILNRLHPFKEIAVVGEKAMDWGADIRKYFFPNALIMADKKEEERFAMLRGRAVEGETRIYVCENYVCRAPYASLEEFLENERGQI